MSADTSFQDVPGAGVTMHLLPIVSWPKWMTAGRRHLVAVNLALVTQDREPAPWPLPADEECVYTCVLDGGAAFDLWAVDDAAVVLHRFGGTYGPAEFVVTPKDKPGEHPIWLTIVNQWGVPVGEHKLPVLIRAAEANTPPAGQDAAESPREEDMPVGLNGIADDLAAADQVTVEIPHRDLPAIRERPAERTPAAPTVPDLPYRDDFRSDADLVPATRIEQDVAPYIERDVPRRRDTARLTRRLGEYYNVAGLRRSRSGGLHADMVPLFPPGAVRGDRVTFTARCSPSDERGTVFAVVAQPGDGSDRSPEPRSIQSAKIPPGIYQVTAELLYPNPGHVRFHGLPAEPREDPRQWREIVANVPRRLPASGGPAHLILAIEISGPDDRTVRERLDSARRLILHVSAEARDFVCYSLITYGPHSVHLGNRHYPEIPVARLAWAGTADDALTELDRLSRRAPVPYGYEHAAQLECVLTDLAADLTGEEGRPVIVTVGVRPPHPPRIDPATGIIPCRHRNDWVVPMTQLRGGHAGIKFGSFRDSGRVDQLWRLLGADAVAADDFYIRGFAQSLGLTSAAGRPTAPPVALPLFAG